MANIRYFSGSRESGGKRSPASEIMRIEIRKNGKLPNADRYKFLLKKKFDEARKKAVGATLSRGFSLPKNIQEARQLSKTAELALKDIAARKAAKEAKALRKMVLITPRTYYNGRLTQKGKIYDVADNVVAKVNPKNGKISTTLGTWIGQYKPQSYFTDMMIQNTINVHSPYFIHQRKMQAMQGSGQDTINLYGHAPQQYQGVQAGVWGNNENQNAGPQAGATGWGIVSGNVWGTFADNAWGTMVDNVWGGTDNNVWGGIGDPGGMWKWRGYHVWGTGNGKNYLSGITKFITSFFGLNLKGLGATDEHLRNRTGDEHLRTRSADHEHTRTSGPSTEHVRTGGTDHVSTTPRTAPRSSGSH